MTNNPTPEQREQARQKLKAWTKVRVKEWPYPGWNGRIGVVLRSLVTDALVVHFDDWQKIDAIFAPEYLEAVNA